MPESVKLQKNWFRKKKKKKKEDSECTFGARVSKTAKELVQKKKKKIVSVRSVPESVKLQKNWFRKKKKKK